MGGKAWAVGCLAAWICFPSSGSAQTADQATGEHSPTSSTQLLQYALAGAGYVGLSSWGVLGALHSQLAECAYVNDRATCEEIAARHPKTLAAHFCLAFSTSSFGTPGSLLFGGEDVRIAVSNSVSEHP